jgi:DUF1707 SHOCT-like domain/Cell wall-active antibiotics response LiaF, C-terminal
MDPMPADRPLRDARERAIAALSDAFAYGDIDVDEFDRRLTTVHRAEALADIDGATADLPKQTALVATSRASQALGGATPTELAASSGVGIQTVAAHMATPVVRGASQSIVAILGGVQRTGVFCPSTKLRVSAVLGGVILDLRQATLQPGVTEIHVTALMGGVQVIVPPALAVEVSGHAVLGGFDHIDRAPSKPDPDQPLLRVHGLAIMGGVAVETRLPGESERDAHGRRRRSAALPSSSEAKRGSR